MEWTNVKDRMPKEIGTYLVYMGRTQGIKMARYLRHPSNVSGISVFSFKREFEPGFYVFESNFWRYVEVPDVKYWMPMPKPPKGDDI